MCYGIFMALYYVFISMSIFTFKVCWEIPCSGAFYFVETIQLIRGANQVSGFYIVWVFHCYEYSSRQSFLFLNINKLLCYEVFRKDSCTTDYWFFTQMSVSIDQWKGKIGCFINRFASNFFFCSYDAIISFNNFLPVLCFLLIVHFCILLRKYYLIWITFCAKLRLRRTRRAMSSLFYVLILICYLRWCNSYFAKWTH